MVIKRKKVSTYNAYRKSVGQLLKAGPISDIAICAVLDVDYLNKWLNRLE